MSIQPGQTILNGKYRIERLIGEGGMARVWLAEELTFGGRPVALKEPRDDLLPEYARELRLRYHREVQVCAALDKARVPNIVRAITAEPYGDTLLLAMEYMPGGDLAALLKQYPEGLPIERAASITLDALAALEGVHAHELEIVHRDVKPSNVLFNEDGKAHLADFGLAQLAGMSGRSQLQGGHHPGTPMYMAPEQAQSPEMLLPAADLYAVGCVLFEMLSGKRYKRVRPGTMPSALRTEMPTWLDDIVAQSLAEDPWDRYAEAAEMVEAFGGMEGGAPRGVEERARASAAEEALQREAEARPLAQQGVEVSARREPERLQSNAKIPRRPSRIEQRLEDRHASRTATTMRQPPAEPRTPPIWQRIGIEMVTIPAGDFLHGEKKERVHLPEYALAKTPVTNTQYKAFVDATRHRAPSHWSGGRIPSAKENHPVVNVSWHDAVAFCGWAGTRLPTEQEWEKGARGTDGREYPWGNDWEVDRCNTDESGVGDTTPVGRYPDAASPYGLLDMAGNVWEWCADWYDEDREGKVVRGGSWYLTLDYARCAYRFRYSPVYRYDYYGFRCMVSP